MPASSWGNANRRFLRSTSNSSFNRARKPAARRSLSNASSASIWARSGSRSRTAARELWMPWNGSVKPQVWVRPSLVRDWKYSLKPRSRSIFVTIT
ncbi:hypothetical protein D3C86_667440 [compost metagenome]